MTTDLQLGNTFLNPNDLIPLIATYQLLPHLLRERLIDAAIAPFTCASDETFTAYQQFYQQHQLTTDAEQRAWLTRYGLQPEHLEAIVTRKLRIQKFMESQWGNKLESYFLKRKRQLDQVVYSLIRTSDAGLAQELYFRIAAGEQGFVELAQEFSEGPEAQTGGFVGPLELGTMHPHLAQLLSASQPGHVWTPKPLGNWFVIVRLERLIPAQLNEFMRQRLLQELFETWLQTELDQLPEADRLWLGRGQRKPTVTQQPIAA